MAKIHSEKQYGIAVRGMQRCWEAPQQRRWGGVYAHIELNVLSMYYATHILGSIFC